MKIRVRVRDWVMRGRIRALGMYCLYKDIHLQYNWKCVWVCVRVCEREGEGAAVKGPFCSLHKSNLQSKLQLKRKPARRYDRARSAFLKRTDGCFASISVISYKCFRFTGPVTVDVKPVPLPKNIHVWELNLTEELNCCTEIPFDANTDFQWNSDVCPGCVRSVERSWHSSWSYSNQSLYALARVPGE